MNELDRIQEEMKEYTRGWNNGKIHTIGLFMSLLNDLMDGHRMTLSKKDADTPLGQTLKRLMKVLDTLGDRES